MDIFLNQDTNQLPPLHFVSGKGGVGKTTLAVGLARKLHRDTGRKVLLVEISEMSFISKISSKYSELSYHPMPLVQGVDVAHWNGYNCLEHYVKHMVKLPKLADRFLGNKWLQALIQVSPGLKDIAMLGQITSGLRNHGPKFDYDYIVIDCMSTGHFLALMNAPGTWAKTIKSGPFYKQSLSIDECIRRKGNSHLYIATVLESYPVEETIDFIKEIDKMIPMPKTIITNKSFLSFSSEEVSTATGLKTAVQFQRDMRKRLEDLELPIFDVPCIENSYSVYSEGGGIFS